MLTCQQEVVCRDRQVPLGYILLESILYGYIYLMVRGLGEIGVWVWLQACRVRWHPYVSIPITAIMQSKFAPKQTDSNKCANIYRIKQKNTLKLYASKLEGNTNKVHVQEGEERQGSSARREWWHQRQHKKYPIKQSPWPCRHISSNALILKIYSVLLTVFFCDLELYKRSWSNIFFFG